MGQQFTNAEGEQVEMDVAELQEWYKKFVVECPSGTLFKHEFKRFFGVQDNQEAEEYVENMFRAFDKNGVSAEKVSVICAIISESDLLQWGGAGAVPTLGGTEAPVRAGEGPRLAWIYLLQSLPKSKSECAP